MKKLYNIILLGFPVKLILWCFYSPYKIIDPIQDNFINSGLFLIWVIVMLDYDDLRERVAFKRLNLVSFILMVIFIFASPFLVELGEKMAYTSNFINRG